MLMSGNSIIGVGSYLPNSPVSNDYFRDELKLDTCDEWIFSRTGIKNRYFAKDNETTVDLAYNASVRAIQSSDIEAGDIGAIIVATTTPDNVFPSVATQVQDRLGISSCMSFDIQAVCAGFVYALSVANALMISSKISKILVIGAERISSILNWSDRSTCVLFGDGAGAVILSNEGNGKTGVISSKMYADGSLRDILHTRKEDNVEKKEYIYMQGNSVFQHAVSKITSSIKEHLLEENMSVNDIDYLIPHQANVRIISSIAKRLNVNNDITHVVSTVKNHANTSAASIPLALDETINTFNINKGSPTTMMLAGIGAGMTWGTIILKY